MNNTHEQKLNGNKKVRNFGQWKRESRSLGREISRPYLVLNGMLMGHSNVCRPTKPVYGTLYNCSVVVQRGMCCCNV